MNHSICTGVGCKREIGWIKTEAGKNMPVDLEKKTVRMLLGAASKAGARVLLVTEQGKTYSGQAVVEPEGILVSGYTAHWASCPATTMFRGQLNMSEKRTV